MRRPTYLSICLFLACLCYACCASAQQKKVSQFESAGLCDLLIDKSGVYHAVFQESPGSGKPLFIYYSNSNNKGATWSKPVTVSNDNTGNGAGYARILQDGNGRIYAIWKRFGGPKASYPQAAASLDGPGGGLSPGTVYYKVLSGGTWSNQVMVNELETVQNSWFATVTPAGSVQVFWSQANPLMIQNDLNIQSGQCDHLRTVTLNGTSLSTFTNLNVPTKEMYGSYPATNDGIENLSGYVDKNGKPHILYEAVDETKKLSYFDGNKTRVVHTYPGYKAGLTYVYPPKLLVDEKGNDHLVFKPSPATLESEQIWDINLATNQTNVIASIQKAGVEIRGFQASQGPNGAMAVTIEAYTHGSNQEAFGIFYSNGVWKNVGLTNNAAKEKFFSKEFPLLGPYKTSISALTRYSSTFASIAYDAAGKKSMLMTISEDMSSLGVIYSSPSIVFIPLDR